MKKSLQREIKRRTKTIFPELQEAEKAIQRVPLEKGRRLVPYGAEKEAFGENLKNIDFRRQLRKLQERQKISQIT